MRRTAPILAAALTLLLAAGFAVPDPAAARPRDARAERLVRRVNAGKKTSSAASSRRSSASSRGPKSIYIVPVTPKCTADVWRCSPWSPCDDTGWQFRGCSTVQGATEKCLSPNAVKPAEQQKCGPDAAERKAANIERWKKLHERMAEDAREMTRQGYAGKQGLRMLDMWEDDFLLRYNEYIRATDPNAIRTLEKKLLELEEQYDEIPTIWY